MLPSIWVVTHVPSKRSGKILTNCTSGATRENWQLGACKTSCLTLSKSDPLLTSDNRGS